MQALLDEARRRLDAGDPASALRLAERELESARAAGSETATRTAAHLVGECLYATGDISAARRSASEALALSERLGDAAAIAADLNLWAVLEITEGRAEDAIDLLRRSLALREDALGPEHPDTIESLNNLAVAMWRTGAQDAAIAVHEDALGRCERALGEDHRRTAETLNALAVKLESRPETQARARALYERGLRSAELALGRDSDLVARVLANLAVARINAGEPETAGALLERSLELHERHFGPRSRWTAYVLDSQAELAFAEGRYDDARQAFERAFVIRMNELGPTDRETLDAALGLMNTVTEIAGEARLVASVEELEGLSSGAALDDALALELPLFALHPELVGSFPLGHPDPEQAADQLRRIAERIGNRTAPDSARLALVERADELVQEADGAFLAGDLPAAARALREAISLLEAARGPSDTSLVEPLQRLKLVDRLAGTETEVLPILRRVAAILADAYGEMHPASIRALAEVYCQERREYGPAGGRETATRIEALARDVLGDTSELFGLLQSVMRTARETVPPGTEPEATPLSALREQALVESSRLSDELLADLDDTPWPALDHAYGPAIDTPVHLRLLLADEERVRTDALGLLAASLLHDDSGYSATEPALRFVRRLASDDRVPGRVDLIAFLEAADAGA